MPLVIVIVVALAIILWATQGSAEQQKVSRARQHNMRKTDAHREKIVMTSYLLKGLSFDEAFEATQKHIVELGYEPCIPRNEYDTDIGYEDTNGWVDDIDTLENIYELRLITSSSTKKKYAVAYDSEIVKKRREMYRKWNREHPNEPQLTDEVLYQNFPKSESEYLADLSSMTFKMGAIPVGSYVTHPGYGTCEVVALNFDPSGLSGTYTLKVVQTGQTVNHIRIGDPALQRVGRG